MSILKNKNSTEISLKAQLIIKNFSKEISDHLHYEQKKDISLKVDEVLKNLNKDTLEEARRKSIIDFDIKDLKFSNRANKKGERKASGKLNLSIIKDFNAKEEYTFNEEEKKDNVKSFYQKQKEHLNKHELRMNHLRKEKIEKEKELMKQRPVINKKSKQLSQLKAQAKDQLNQTNVINNNLPLYLRSKEVIQEQEEKKDQLKKMYEMINIVQEAKNNKIKVKPYNKEKFDKWVNDKMSWFSKKDKKTTQETDIDQEQCSFNPKINARSNLLMKDKHEDFLNRSMYYEEKKKSNLYRIEKEVSAAFEPKLSKALPEFIRAESVDRYKVNKLAQCEILFYNKNSQNGDKTVCKLNLAQMKSKEKNKIIENSNEMSGDEDDLIGNSHLHRSAYDINIRDNTYWDSSKENIVILKSGKFYEIFEKLKP